MNDNWRIAIGYICVMFVAISFILGISWIMSPQEFTFKFEIDNNTKEAVESVEYPIVDIKQPENICYSEICYLDLKENQIGGCSMGKVDCKLWKDKYGFALGEKDE
jgi:hypothetical protein